jgi:hypothetical protein
MRKLGWAWLLTLIQILFALAWAPKTGNVYLRLLNWDSDHYRSIAVNGYRIPDHPITSDDIHAGLANVVFLPGYPMASRWVQRTFNIPIDFALLAVAQLSAVLFWFYFFAFLELGSVARKSQLLGAFAIAIHPAAFYMIAGYTESLFLASMMGFFYWIERGKVGGGIFFRLVALLHGLLLCWTRIVGVAVAFYPVVRERMTGVLLFALSVTSLVGFFIFCQVHFSDWAIYFHLEETGWKNHRLYFALFNPMMYLPPVFFEDTIQSLNKASVTFTMYMLVVVAIAEWKIARLKLRVREVFGFLSSIRGSLFFIAFGMFYIALTGKANSNLDSMLRYTLPSYILLVAEVLLLNTARRQVGEGPLFFAGANVGNRRARIKIIAAVIFAVGFQAWCIYRFTHGHWVA